MTNNGSNTNRLVGMAILIAIVVVLQIFASYIKFGPFSITLVMVPIVIGAVMYGISSGAALGAIFGVVVLVFVINGVDVGAHMLWVANPPITALFCILKGAAAGYAAGFVYTLAAKKNTYMGVVLAALTAPLVNTGIFLIAMPLFYYDTLKLWAGDTDILYFTIIGLTGINFLLEIGINAVLSPGIIRIIHAVKRI